MSGGSFDYLYAKTTGGIIDNVEDLVVMAHHLRRNGAHTAANELDALANAIGDLNERIDHYRELMRRIEWWQSGDYGFDQVLEHTPKEMNQ